MKSDIGINQRIPISILEMALLATLDDQASSDYFVELAQTEYEGENRIKKALSVMNRLTVKNELMPFLLENAELVKASLRNKNDRSLILAAVICSAYGFAYDVTSTMGKYFHVQEQVITSLVQDKMAAKYGSNRSLPNAMNCVLPMLIEAGIIDPVKVTRSALQNATSVASTLLTTESVVADIKEDTPAMPMQGGMGGMM